MDDFCRLRYRKRTTLILKNAKNNRHSSLKKNGLIIWCRVGDSAIVAHIRKRHPIVHRVLSVDGGGGGIFSTTESCTEVSIFHNLSNNTLKLENSLSGYDDIVYSFQNTLHNKKQPESQTDYCIHLISLISFEHFVECVI